MPTPKVPVGKYYAIELTTGQVSEGATFGAIEPITPQISYLFALAPTPEGNGQGQLNVTIEDTASEAAITAQGPAVLTDGYLTYKGYKPNRVLRTRAGDVVGLTESGTLVADFWCSGDQATFGLTGDAVLREI